MTILDDGSYEYEFTLKGILSEVQKESLQYSCDNEKVVKIGEPISYKGIPYYMAQLNEFARTFSAAFNKVHKSLGVTNSVSYNYDYMAILSFKGHDELEVLDLLTLTYNKNPQLEKVYILMARLT